MDNKKWFKDAKFGMMIHWGLYSLLGGEYKGKYMPFIGEWIQSYFRIPNAEYHKLAGAFNPIGFNAEEWVKCAKDAGMQYMVVTTKHHEGFALFKSKASAFNVVDATPFKRDIIAELAEACYKHSMKLGLYYSQAIDWSHPDAICYRKSLNCGVATWGNEWDFPDESIKDYSRCFEEKIKPQVTELLTGYGDISLIWFDTPIGLDARYSEELYKTVKHYQPDCLINSRIGNGKGDYCSTGDNEIPDDDKGDRLFESPITLNDTWGFKPQDQNWKSAERVIELKEHLNARGINMLLNIGPDHLGRFPAKSIEILKAIGEKTRK